MGYLCSWTVEELRDVIALLQEDVRSATEDTHFKGQKHYRFQEQLDDYGWRTHASKGSCTIDSTSSWTMMDGGHTQGSCIIDSKSS